MIGSTACGRAEAVEDDGEGGYGVVLGVELAGMVTATGRRAAAPFIAVLRVRDGKTVHWREYQNVPAMAEALAQNRLARVYGGTGGPQIDKGPRGCRSADASYWIGRDDPDQIAQLNIRRHQRLGGIFHE